MTIEYKNIIDNVISMYNTSVNKISKVYDETGNGGYARLNNGVLVENITHYIFQELILLHKFKSYKNINRVKKNKFKVNSENGFINVSVDNHIHIKDINKNFYIECKSSLDKCNMDRADCDLNRIKQASPNGYTFIIAMESDIKPNTLNFFMDQGNISKTYFLLDGRRSSSKPYWRKKFKKEINIDNLTTLITDMDKILSE